MSEDAFHNRLLAIVTKLPGAYEDRPWGSVHCKVDGKIFVGWGRTDDGTMSLGIRVPLEEQVDLVEYDPRFTIAKYVGKYGGVDMRLGASPDWREVERYIVQSYRLIAPKKRIKELDALHGGNAAGAAPGAAAKGAAKAGGARTSKPAARRTAKAGGARRTARTNR